MKFQEIKELATVFATEQNLILEDVADFVLALTGKNVLEDTIKKQRQPSQESTDRLQQVREEIKKFEPGAKFSILQLVELTGLEKKYVQYAVSQLQDSNEVFISGKLEIKARGKKPNLYSKVISE